MDLLVLRYLDAPGEEVAEPLVVVRRRVDAFDVWLHEEPTGPLVQEHYRSVLDERSFRRLVGGVTLRVVGGRVASRHRVVVGLVAPVAELVAGTGHEDVEPVLRVRVVTAPSGGTADLVVAGPQPLADSLGVG